MLHYKFFNVALHNFLCCSIFFSDVALHSFAMLQYLYLDVALHSLHIFCDVAVGVFHALGIGEQWGTGRGGGTGTGARWGMEDRGAVDSIPFCSDPILWGPVWEGERRPDRVLAPSEC